MSTYYTIIAGKRYDASLISNAKFRTRGAGDGRISVQDAQDLWKIALDGGRITEIEEDTFAYLFEAFNWTDAAKAWIEKELSAEVDKNKSYYKVIDGLRYDRKILEEADKAVAGKGDGRISVADAELLFPLIGDFGDVTIVEERTLEFLFNHYKWTPEAEEWFRAKVDPISKQSSVGPLLRHIMETEYGFKQLPFNYFKEEALQQMLDHENKVSLPDALRKALDSLLNDTSEKTYRSAEYSDNPKEFLEGGRLVLLPGDMASEPSLSSFPAPSGGESIRENWIFGLELFDLTDDIFWMIVPRDESKPAYNYIGGPNVGDIYHIEEEEAFFTIVVKSCDEPYPGITVDVQDPTGKYIVSKSDEEGKVLITGPAGNYSIYASDGWSFQSKSFEWDGEGNDQVRNVVLDC